MPNIEHSAIPCYFGCPPVEEVAMRAMPSGMRVVEQDGDTSRPLIASLSAAVYPPEVLAVTPWRDVESARSQHRIMVMDADHCVISTAGLLVRKAFIDGQPVKIGGVGGVMTMPSQQGSGLGRTTMNAVAELMRRLGEIRFGVLFCEPKTSAFTVSSIGSLLMALSRSGRVTSS